MAYHQSDISTLERQTFVETFKYKLIYVYTIDDRKHEGYLKVGDAQHAQDRAYAFAPLHDFILSSDIDWSRPVSEIDAQLYAKYGITKSEQKFIESMIKPM